MRPGDASRRVGAGPPGMRDHTRHACFSEIGRHVSHYPRGPIGRSRCRDDITEGGWRPLVHGTHGRVRWRGWSLPARGCGGASSDDVQWWGRESAASRRPDPIFHSVREADDALAQQGSWTRLIALAREVRWDVAGCAALSRTMTLPAHRLPAQYRPASGTCTAATTHGSRGRRRGPGSIPIRGLIEHRDRTTAHGEGLTTSLPMVRCAPPHRWTGRRLVILWQRVARRLP
jgi:hypothetical protein